MTISPRPLRIAALIVAAGRGTRAGGDLPKQYQRIGGTPVLARTLAAFAAHPRIDSILTVIHPDDRALYDAKTINDAKLLPPVPGGSSRAESVLNGLVALDPTPDLVLVHDGARPFVSAQVIDAVIDALAAHDGAVAMIPAVDSMRMAAPDGSLGPPVPRDGVQRAQTPQGFRFAILHDCLSAARKAGTLATIPDDATAALDAGHDIVATMGDPLNIKITTPEDFTMAERLLALPDIRHGQGFDVHAFESGDHVILCGVKIPHDKTLRGHSDADVGLHALTDAILGGAAMGDIGRHFPPSDPQWKGADSAIFLIRAVEIVREMGFALSNVDITLMCERPKITPHSEAMRARVADLCGIDLSRVSVKATTTERLGFTGREEGIAALASATLIRAGEAS